MLPGMKAWKILLGATGLALAATGFSAEALRLTAYERAQGWRLLFDGKSLSDWRGYRESKVPANWKAVDGHLVGSGGTPLIAEEDYQDFELTFEWKVSEGGVGEVYFHVNEDGKNPEETGPVMQLAGHNGPIGGNGGLTSYWHEVSVQWDTWYQAKIMVFGYQVEYWINGEKVYDFQDRRSYNPEEAKFDAALSKGMNRVLVKCGNRGGGWQFGLAIAAPSDYAFLQGPAPGAFDPEAYRKFAQSAEGQAERGKSLFADLKGLACVKCHAVGGQGGAVGPELTSVGAKYPKDELISAVLYPSSKISSGYEPVVIATADGKVVTGIVKGETAESVEVEDVDAKRIKIAKSEIDERKRSDVSLMPNGLAEGLTRQDFADLIAYLGTLKDKEIGAKKPASGDER